jgi:hypothetical protein
MFFAHMSWAVVSTWPSSKLSQNQVTKLSIIRANNWRQFDTPTTGSYFFVAGLENSSSMFGELTLKVSIII